MATDFTINGATATLAPAEQLWRVLPISRQHNMRSALGTFWEVDLAFPSCSITHMRQWCEPASAASVNLTILDKYKVAYTDLSGVHLTVTNAPSIEAGVSGPFTLTVRGVT